MSCTHRLEASLTMLIFSQESKHHEPFGEMDHETPNAGLLSMQATFYLFENNEASIKQICKVRNPTMRKRIPHTSC